MLRLPLECGKALLTAAVSALALHGGAATSGVHEMLLQVVINGQSAGDFVPILEVPGSGFHAPRELFDAARLRLPAETPLRAHGRAYYSINAIPGSRSTLEPARQTLRISVPGSAFESTVVDGSRRQRTAPEISGIGMFLNHDFQVAGDGRHNTVSGVAEGGVFSSLGVLTTRFAARDLVTGRRAVRLETQFFRDFPDRMETLTVGDSVSSAAPWARQVYYGGVRWASKFSTQPSFIPQALPAMSGEAVLPSVVDIYADNVRRLSTSVQPGPFAINNIPVLSSQGTMSMVVTDIMGRQQIITQSYSASPQLLRKGVEEFSYEAGAIRHSYGVASSGYSGLFADATIRRGITDSVTVNGRGEAHPEGETGSIGIDFRLPFLIAGGGAAASLSHGEGGRLLYAELSHASRAFGVSAHYQTADSSFRQLGLPAGEKPEVRLLQTSMSRSLSRRVTAAAGYLQRDGRTNLDVQAVSASLNIGVGRGLVMLAANRSLLKDRGVLFSMTLVLPVSERVSVTESLQSTGRTPSSTTEVVRQLGMTNGYGYRLKGASENDDVEAAFSLQDSQGLSMIEVARASGQTGWRASHNGGLVILGGHVMPSRWLTDSFGVVEMSKEAKGVEVSANNQPVAKVGRRGIALIPWLAAYEANAVQVDPDSLPMDVVLDQSRKTVAPMPRSGVLVKFTPQRATGVVVRLVTGDGRPVPAGALVTIKGIAEDYTVALRGEVFLAELPLPAELTVRWDGQSCSVRVPKSPSGAVLPRIGPLRCVSRKALAPVAKTSLPVPAAADAPEMSAALPGQGPYSKPALLDSVEAQRREGPAHADDRASTRAPARPEPKVAPVKPPAAGLFAAQVGSFEDREKAEHVSGTIRARHMKCRIVLAPGQPEKWRVLVGEESSPEAGRRLARQLRREFGAAFVVGLDETAQAMLGRAAK